MVARLATIFVVVVVIALSQPVVCQNANTAADVVNPSRVGDSCKMDNLQQWNPLAIKAKLSETASTEARPTIAFTVANCSTTPIKISDLGFPIFSLYPYGFDPADISTQGAIAYGSQSTFAKLAGENLPPSLAPSESFEFVVSLDELEWSEIMASYFAIVPYSKIVKNTYRFFLELRYKDARKARNARLYVSNTIPISVQ